MFETTNQKWTCSTSFAHLAMESVVNRPMGVGGPM
jgi:hypothetical protein